MGREAASRGRLGDTCTAAPRWPVAPLEVAQRSPVGGVGPAATRRPCVLIAGVGTRWRPRLEVELRGLVPGDSQRSGKAWLKSYRYGPVLVTVVVELPIGAAPSRGGCLNARGGAARLVAARLGPSRPLGV